MKKKLILMLALTIIACCLFALGVNAAATNEFGTVETSDTIDLTGMAEDDDVYVVLYDGAEYHTYPSRYIVTNANELTFNFEKIKVFGKAYDVTSIIRLQVPSHVLTFPSAFAYGKNPNIVEVSFPSDSSLKKFSYGTFETCEKLEKINIPATTSELGGHMFNRCSALTDVTFDAGFSMTSLPNSMFKACSSLKTIVIPNSVTELKGGTFYSCTSIEKVVLGANLAKMGNDEFAGAGSGTKAVKLYAPASLFASLETIPSRVYTWDKNHMKNVTYYFTGTKAQAEAIISKAEFANIKNAKVVAWDVAKGENHADYVVSGSNVFVYGYNYCDAFYGGNHAMSGNDTMQFVSYFESITFADVCTREGCGNTVVDESKTINPLFTWKGFSVSEQADANGCYSVTQGFYVDMEAIKAYVAIKTDFAFGVVASVGKENPISVVDGEVVADSNVIFAPISKNSNGELSVVHNYFDIKVTGIDENNLSTQIAFNGYVVDGGEIYYLHAGET
ncbi:MAG: leucine-rich repeat domain-containing protein, partial [Clostridia bacterium]|nr:leucine-rich repeat domain-containing protein [Clostridia bacterium]